MDQKDVKITAQFSAAIDSFFEEHLECPNKYGDLEAKAVMEANKDAFIQILDWIEGTSQMIKIPYAVLQAVYAWCLRDIDLAVHYEFLDQDWHEPLREDVHSRVAKRYLRALCTNEETLTPLLDVAQELDFDMAIGFHPWLKKLNDAD